MIEQWLLATGAAIFGVLGAIHLVFTYFTNKFDTRDPRVGEAMKETTPRITPDTSMWQAWVGFNASHSIGALVFSAIYLYLTIKEYDMLQASLFLLGLPVLVGVIYSVLAILYWFRVPSIGIALATLCFIESFVLHADT